MGSHHLENGSTGWILTQPPRLRQRSTDWSEQGNFSNVKSVGKGTSEYKIDFGPGYRIYFGQEGDYLIILLGGGSKKTQNMDIKRAQVLWAQYKQDKESKKTRR